MTEILEATMLLCFGCSWPLSVYKNIKAKSAKAMSLQFILLIIVGYIAGICAKLVSHKINYVMVVYLFNLAVVSLNLVIYFVNLRYDRMEEKRIAANEANMAQYSQRPMIKTNASQTAKAKEYFEMNKKADFGGIVFFGSSFFSSLKIGELTQRFGIDETIYNRSFDSLCVTNADESLEKCIVELKPEKIFVNIGDEDVKDSNLDIDDFIERYHWMLYDFNRLSKAKIYIVSVISSAEKTSEVNKRLRDLAKETGCQYVDAERAVSYAYPALKLFEIMGGYIRRSPITFSQAMTH